MEEYTVLLSRTIRKARERKKVVLENIQITPNKAGTEEKGTPTSCASFETGPQDGADFLKKYLLLLAN